MKRTIDLSDAYLATLTSAATTFFAATAVALRQGWIVPEGSPVTAGAIAGFFTALGLVATFAILEGESEYE